MPGVGRKLHSELKQKEQSALGGLGTLSGGGAVFLRIPGTMPKKSQRTGSHQPHSLFSSTSSSDFDTMSSPAIGSGPGIQLDLFWKKQCTPLASQATTGLLSAEPSLHRHYLSGVERYFCFSKRFSRPISCSSVNTVRLRRPFLAFVPGSPEPVPSSFPRSCSSSGRCEAPAVPGIPGPVASNAEPSPEQPSGASGNLNTAACSAFSTAAGEEKKGTG